MSGMMQTVLFSTSVIICIYLILVCSIPAAEALDPSKAPTDDCAVNNEKCAKCVENVGCLYCYSDKKCKPWDSGILPPPSLCGLGDARWSVCWLNFKAMIIAIAVMAGILIIACCVCVYVCCFRGASKRKKASFDREEQKYDREREERKTKSDERRAERKVKADEIRAKYGISPRETSYERFENT